MADPTSAALARAQRARPRREREIQPEIERLLRARLRVVWPNNRERAGAAHRAARIGVPGIADVLALWDNRSTVSCAAVGCETTLMHPRDRHTRPFGVLLSIEIKRPHARTDKRRAAAQLAWQRAVHRAGGIALRGCTSAEEVARELGWA